MVARREAVAMYIWQHFPWPLAQVLVGACIHGAASISVILTANAFVPMRVRYPANVCDYVHRSPSAGQRGARPAVSYAGRDCVALHPRLVCSCPNIFEDSRAYDSFRWYDSLVQRLSRSCRSPQSLRLWPLVAVAHRLIFLVYYLSAPFRFTYAARGHVLVVAEPNH